MIICPNCGEEAQENSPELWKHETEGWWNNVKLLDRFCPHCRCFWNSEVPNMHVFGSGDGVAISIKPELPLRNDLEELENG